MKFIYPFVAPPNRSGKRPNKKPDTSRLTRLGTWPHPHPRPAAPLVRNSQNHRPSTEFTQMISHLPVPHALASLLRAHCPSPPRLSHPPPHPRRAGNNPPPPPPPPPAIPALSSRRPRPAAHGGSRVLTRLSVPLSAGIGGLGCVQAKGAPRRSCRASVSAARTEMEPSEVNRGLYAQVEPYDTGFLKVSDVHTIYYEQSGNPHGHVSVYFFYYLSHLICVGL